MNFRMHSQTYLGFKPCTVFVETSISDVSLDSEHVSEGSYKISTTVMISKT